MEYLCFIWKKNVIEWSLQLPVADRLPPCFCWELYGGVNLLRPPPRGKPPLVSLKDSLFLFLYSLHTGKSGGQIAPLIGILKPAAVLCAIHRVRPLLHQAMCDVFGGPFPYDLVRTNLAVCDHDELVPLERYNRIVVSVDSTTFPIHKPHVS